MDGSMFGLVILVSLSTNLFFLWKNQLSV